MTLPAIIAPPLQRPPSPAACAADSDLTTARDVRGDNAPYTLREVVDPDGIVALLRLRHRIYFEEHGYSLPKPMQLDLTAHDVRARLLGVFHGPDLIGGARLVFRTEQPAALLLRAVRAVVGEAPPEAQGDSLPSEEAFDLRAALGPDEPLPEVEVSRLALLRATSPPWLAKRVMVALLAVIHALGARRYLYSCAAERAASYARVGNPRYMLDSPCADGITSDGFVFPQRTVAAVADCIDSPFWSEALIAAAEYRCNGQVALERPSPEIAHAY